jgi:hypothetical protein
MEPQPRSIREWGAALSGHARTQLARVPASVLCVMSFFLVAALLMAIHTALSPKNAGLRLKVQHSFRSAELSVWVDGDLAYSGTLHGSVHKKFGLIPESVQGSLSELVPVTSGQHTVRVRVVSDEGKQEDQASAEFAPNIERELAVSARHSGLNLAWPSTASASSPATGGGWFARYAGTLFLTIAGSIISAITGFALRAMPAYIRTRQSTKAESTPALQ